MQYIKGCAYVRLASMNSEQAAPVLAAIPNQWQRRLLIKLINWHARWRAPRCKSATNTTFVSIPPGAITSRYLAHNQFRYKTHSSVLLNNSHRGHVASLKRNYKGKYFVLFISVSIAFIVLFAIQSSENEAMEFEVPRFTFQIPVLESSSRHAFRLEWLVINPHLLGNIFSEFFVYNHTSYLRRRNDSEISVA